MKTIYKAFRFSLIRRDRQFYFGLPVQILEVQRKNLLIELKDIFSHTSKPCQFRHHREFIYNHTVLLLSILNLLSFLEGRDQLFTLKFKKFLVNAPRPTGHFINFLLFTLFNCEW